MYLFTAKTQSYDPKIDQIYDVEFLIDGDHYENAEDAVADIDKAIETLERNGKVIYIEWRKVDYATDPFLSHFSLTHQYNELDFIRDFNGDF